MEKLNLLYFAVLACAFVFLVSIFHNAVRNSSWALEPGQVLIQRKSGSSVGASGLGAQTAGSACSWSPTNSIATQTLLRCLAGDDWIGGTRPPTTVYSGADLIPARVFLRLLAIVAGLGLMIWLLPPHEIEARLKDQGWMLGEHR